MFRRSRFSIRPNVGATARAAAAPTKEAPPSNQESSETPIDANEDRVPAAGTDQSVVTPSEKTSAEGGGNDQNAEGVNSLAAVQRRKRFSIKPKVAPGRPSALARTPKPTTKTPVAAATTPPPGLNEPPTSNTQTRTTATHSGQQRLSEKSKQPEPTPVPSGSPDPSGFLLPEESQADPPMDEGKKLEHKAGSQVKEVPPKQFDKVPQPFKPDRESIELSEKAKSLVSSKTGLSMSPSAFSLCRLLNDTSDIQRLAKAQKLRALLREETHKVKKMKKIRTLVKEFTVDPTKMTMGDLIHYLPLSNPMTSSIATGAEENETIIPPSPAREQTPERRPEPEKPLKTATPRNDEEEEQEEEEEEELMVPQVKVAEDGTLIIDEESLTVEVQRAKGPNPAEDRDPIFERGSTTTYSSFKKMVHTKPWFSEETDMFFLAISMVGTDFSMIGQLFPHRTRTEIKNKFKKEERENSWRIDKAFKEKRKLDIEYFSKLLEKILEFHKNKKKLQSLSKKNAPKKPREKKSKGKKAAKKQSDVDEDDEEDGTEMPDLHDDDDDGGEEEEEEEGEKENEDLCIPSKPKRQRKRKMAAVNEDPDCTRKNKGKSSTQGAATEEAPPATPDMSKETEDVNAAKDTTIKPAKLARGRAATSLLSLGRKWGKKAAPASTKAKDIAMENGEEPTSDGAAAEQANQNSSPLKEANKNKLDSADEDEVTPPPKPTRYGRVPKPTKPLNYPAKDESRSSGSDATTSSSAKTSASAAKPKCTAKRERPCKQESSQQSKKPKLVTLRASQSEFSDDDDNETQHDQKEREDEEEDIEEGAEHPARSPSQDSSAPVFVPASLRSPPAVISEVEETMEELDILDNMPDVLGISHDALYHEASRELTQNDSGTAEPEHQLDLLVDVIDFLSAEHPEVTEEQSCNEAAQTLLTIGCMTQLSQSQMATEETASGSAAQEENCDVVLVFDHGLFDTPEAVATEEQGTTDGGGAAVIAISDQTGDGQKTVSDSDPSPKKDSPQARKGRLPKVKPKPNLGRGSRVALPKPQSDTSTPQMSDEAVNNQVPESPSAPEETKPVIPVIEECAKDKLTEELPVSQEESACPAQSENQNHGSSGALVSTTNSVHEGSQSSATVISSVEEAQASQTEESEVKSGCQSTRSRLQKVKPNLTQTSRSARSEPQTTKDSGEEDSKPVPVPGVEPEVACSALLKEQSRSTEEVTTERVSQNQTVSESAVEPSEQDTESTEESSSASTTCQMRRGRVKPKPVLQQTSRLARLRPQSTNSKPVSRGKPEVTCNAPHEEPGPSIEEVTTGSGSDQSVTQNQTLSESAVEPRNQGTESMSGSTDEKLESNGNLVASDSTVVEFQVVAPPESSDHPPALTPAEDRTFSQKEESSVASTTCQTRRGRVKPKPVLGPTSKTARVRPQTAKEFEKTVPLPTMEPGRQERTEDGLDQSVVEKPMEFSSEPSQEVRGSTSECTVEKMESGDSENGLTLDLTPTEAIAQHDIAAVKESKDTPVEGVTVSQKENSGVSSPCQTKRGRSLKIKPKPNLAKTSRSARLETQTIKDSVEEDSSQTPHPKVEPALACSSSPGETCRSAGPGSACSPTSETVQSAPPSTKDPVPSVIRGSTEDTVTEVEALPICTTTIAEQPGQSTGFASAAGPSLETCSTQKPTEGSVSTDVKSSSETSRPSLPQRRRPLPKVKPNLASLTRSPRAKLQPKMVGTASSSDTSSNVTSELTCVDNSGTEVTNAEDEHKHLTTIQGPTNTELSETTYEEKGRIGACSEGNTVLGTACVAENQAVLTDLVSKIPERDEPPAPSDVQSPAGDFIEANISSDLETDINIRTDPTESHAQPCSESTESQLQSQEAAGETRSEQSTKSLQPESLPSAESPKKGPLGRRGRLIKPKPNLGRSVRPPQSQPIQNTTPSEPDSGSVQLQPVLKKLVEGAPESPTNQRSPADEAGSSTHLMPQQSLPDSSPAEAVSALGCVTQEVPSSSQNTSTFGTEGTQSLSVFLSSEHVPSDPDEPFFILSLTEIPLSSSGNGMDSAAEPRPQLPIADQPRPQQRLEPELPSPLSSVPGEGSAPAGDGCPASVPLPTPVEESGDTSIVELSSIIDKDEVMEKLSATQVENNRLKSPKLQGAESNNAETEIPPANPKASGRRAKRQVKPNPTRTTESATNQDSELPGHSSQPETTKAETASAADDSEIQTGSDEHGKSEIPAGGRSLRGQMTKKERSAGKSSAPASVPPSPCGKAASRSSKTPKAKNRPTSTPPSTSTSLDVAPARQEKEPTRSTALTPSPTPAAISHSATEVSAPQESDCVEISPGEVEEISVSQYFLSDIFTEVDDT